MLDQSPSLLSSLPLWGQDLPPYFPTETSALPCPLCGDYWLWKVCFNSRLDAKLCIIRKWENWPQQPISDYIGSFHPHCLGYLNHCLPYLQIDGCRNSWWLDHIQGLNLGKLWNILPHCLHHSGQPSLQELDWQSPATFCPVANFKMLNLILNIPVCCARVDHQSSCHSDWDVIPDLEETGI